jgi:primary-amine oxidase
VTTVPDAPSVPHPLEPLSAAELERAVEIYRRDQGADDARFSTVTLCEPSKEALAAFRSGDLVDRRAEVVVVAGPDALAEAVVSITHDRVDEHRVVPGARPALLFEEVLEASAALSEDERWIEALRRRGIDDPSAVQMDPWPPGSFGHPFEAGRRLTKVIPYLRHFPEDNGYAHPIENVAGFVDCATGEVVAVEDGEVVPVPQADHNYRVDDVGPLRTDLRPLDIVQPEGPSFTVDGHLIRWQRWQLRVSMHPIEGLVLHQVAYEDQGRVRPIAHRMSISEMVVPYGSNHPFHHWKNAFDCGEWGLGRMVNSLELGCDCLGVIHYFDADVVDERGQTRTQPNVICLHEEDYGILWKHQDLHAFTTETRRSRRLVVSSIHTVGNYEYGFYWYFYLDGTLQLEVKLTGIVQPQAVAEGDDPGNANLIAPGLAAPHHQHLFCVRLDLDVDGPANSVYETNVEATPAGPDNPYHNGITATSTLLATERAAQRRIDPARSRSWRIVNRGSANGLGQPVSYKLLPGATPTLYARPESMVHQRATFATNNLWVTPYAAAERRAAGEYPSQSGGGDGLPEWTAADRDIDDTDLVVWYTFGVTHLVRPEDFPVMPVEYTGFSLVPFGFFDRNPALDVPPSNDHCH